MKVTSPSFQEGGMIPIRFTCDGENINPRLEITDVPEETVALALIMEDPDAPTGTFYHWVLWNIDPTLAQIEEDSVPKDAVEGKNSGGKNSYLGPCPPSGTHRYIFRIFALREKLNLSSSTTAFELEGAIQGRTWEVSELSGLYTRP
jgi:Raf kinase inhibitor-like YbhB/YbcL family protein